MGKGATLTEVIYLDLPDERVPVLIGIGDTVVAQDWAEKEYPYPPKPDLSVQLSAAEVKFNIKEYRRAKTDTDAMREWRTGLYAVYLGAKRGGLRGSELGWREWLSLVTMPVDDDDPAKEPEPGESDGPPSGT